MMPNTTSTMRSKSLSGTNLASWINVERADDDAEKNHAHGPVHGVARQQAVEPAAEIGAGDHRQHEQHAQRAQVNRVPEQRAPVLLGLLQAPGLFVHALLQSALLVTPLLRVAAHARYLLMYCRMCFTSVSASGRFNRELS